MKNWLLFSFAPLAACGQVPLEKIELEEGFTISIFADNVPGARSLALGEKGTIFVGTRKVGKVYALRDRDGDGQADEKFILATGLRMPNGVAFKGGDLYVAEVDRILKFSNIEAHLDSPPKPEVVYDGFPSNKWHGWKYLRFGPDGKLYTAVGAPCNVCDPKEPFATIVRFNPDGTGFEIFARGIRSVVGFDWHPKTETLWFNDNGRDWLGDDLPPDELNHAPKEGLHFGFPYCFGRSVADPYFGNPSGKSDLRQQNPSGKSDLRQQNPSGKSDLRQQNPSWKSDLRGQAEEKKRACREFTPPEWEYPAHVAPLGMRFYRGSQFPEKYRGQLFVAQHGSWNRSEPIGYRVVWIEFKDGKPVAEHPFATGWLQPDGAVLGRPVDLLELPDGSLLVSDDKAGVIYRIQWTGR